MKPLLTALFTFFSFTFAQDCLSGSWLYESGYDTFLQSGAESDVQFVSTEGVWQLTLEGATTGYAATYNLTDFTPVVQAPVAGGPSLEVHVRMNGTGYATYQTEGKPNAGNLVITESNPDGIAVESQIVMGGQVMPGFNFLAGEVFTPTILTNSSYSCSGSRLELVIDNETETPIVFSRSSP